MAKNVTPRELSAKEINNGSREIVNKTSALTQVLRQFETLYSKRLTSCNGLTVEAWMTLMGVSRFEKTLKDGTVRKGGYTPGTIRAGWCDGMKDADGQMYTYKNVPAKYTDKNGNKYLVYTRAEAEKLTDAKCITRCMQVKIGDDKWSVALIMRGLKQGKKFDTYAKQAEDSDLAWGALDEVCIVKYVTVDGALTRVIETINKSEVVF